MTDMTFGQYEALAHLVKYGNLYHLRTLTVPARTEETTEWWRSVDPENPDDHKKIIHDKHVQWAIEEGLAQTAEHDPVLMRGKVVPSHLAKGRLENHGLTPESEGVGVHLSHCCLEVHGCKYSHEFCPVTTKMFPPDEARCGACYEDDQWNDETVEGLSDRAMIDELESRGYTVTEDEEADEKVSEDGASLS